MKTKLLSFVLLSVMLLGVLAGCGEKPDTNITTAPETTASVTGSADTTVAEATTENIDVPATVYATFADNTDIDLTNAQRFSLDNSLYATEVVFTANKNVRSLSLGSIDCFESEDPNENDFEFTPMFTTDNFDEPLVVTMTFWSDTPSYGITYTDENGTEHCATINTSGTDRTLMLSAHSGFKNFSAEKYKVDYCGQEERYANAKESYRAGTKVTLYYTQMATEMNYTFKLDGETIDTDSEGLRYFMIEFTMPEHDVVLDCQSYNSWSHN